MLSFLEKVSDHIYGKYCKNISDISIILPNKRAGLYLKKLLASKFGRPIWSPKIYSIDEFMTELSGFTIPEPITLLFELYEIYKKKEGDQAQTVEEFFRWAPILLQDFNEIDSYCVDGVKLFSYLDEIRAVELWNPSTHELSDFQKHYLRFWKSLGELYKEFSEHLRQKKQAYHGMAFRAAADNLKKLPSGSNEKNSGICLFIGFNALTKAEESVIHHYTKLGKAEILWDADAYYFKNKNQEAGKFLRKYINPSAHSKSTLDDIKGKKSNLSFFGELPILSLDEDLLKGEKNIEIIGVPGQVAQAKIAGDLLDSLSKLKLPGKEFDFPDTAIVLSDESLLIPVLQSIPGEIENVNITMGYPLKCTAMHSFWNAVFNLHENAKGSPGKVLFFHKNIIQVLSHPFLAFSSDHAALMHEIISEIKLKNRIFIAAGEIEQIANAQGEKKEFSQLKPLFSDLQNDPLKAIEICKYLSGIKISTKNIEAEFVARYFEIFVQIQSHLIKPGILKDLRSLRMIFNQLANTHTAPFSGEPLTGLQIMGILETRTLDFETLILLSANEDVLPSGKKQNSFIPLDVKNQFGLPTYTDRDAIFAYHFYRLIQKAKKVYLLYNNDVSKSFGFGSGEKSRFITQILEELPKINPNAKITEKIHSFHSLQKNKTNLKILKNDLIVKRLDEIAEKGFSPSAINTFLNCPLDFYFKYIIGLREEKEVEDIIEAAAFGDFVHEALHKIFLPFTCSILSPADIEQQSNKCAQIIKEVFLKKFKEEELKFGKNHLSLKVAENIIRSYLKKEIEFIKKSALNREFLSIIALETELSMEIIHEGKKIKFHGKVDRIDKIGQNIRIIDYKTGALRPGDLKIETAEIADSEKTKPKAIQLLLYGMMFLNSYPDGNFITNGLSSGVVSLRKLSEGFMPLKLDGIESIKIDSLQNLEKELGKIISKMYDADLPFIHSHQSKYCEHCT